MRGSGAEPITYPLFAAPERDEALLPDPRTLRRRFAGIRVVGDVHGDAEGFEMAAEGARAAGLFLIQLGDLTDRGPDAPGVLRTMFRLIDEGTGLFVLGNHDHKLRRALTGANLRPDPEGLELTLVQLGLSEDGEDLARRMIDEVGRAPAWLRLGQRIFVHGGFHTAMLREPPPPGAGLRRPEGPVTRALFGEITGRVRDDGYPERLHRWIDRVPPGIIVYCGHETRSTDGRPATVTGAQGGVAVFVDTGAGKGGHLSWIDLGW
ncbi:metallophosphoesterase [Acetobacteraceae bacterium H6797]|nr:metallophosphoesterase [Acetobacteraceae bacterium H6797]